MAGVRKPRVLDLQCCLAEFVGTALLVLIGCGCAAGVANADGGAWVLQVALTFGFAVTSLAYAIGHVSGAQMNCAVTLGLVLTSHCGALQGAGNVLAQCLGACTGALLLVQVIPPSMDRTGNLASNGVSAGYEWHHALVGEAVMTFLLMYVVLQTAVHYHSLPNRPQAFVAIGLAVFLGNAVLIPVDGCSLNPARSLGPALVAYLFRGSVGNFRDMWVFVAGPLAGAALAAAHYTWKRRCWPASFIAAEGDVEAAEPASRARERGHGHGHLEDDDLPDRPLARLSTMSFGRLDVQACSDEFLATALFAFIGCGSAAVIAKVEGSAWILHVALTFGFAITTLAYATSHTSGGHLNCAVTLGLVLSRNCSVLQGAANLAAQALGAIAGALLLAAVVPASKDLTKSLGATTVGAGFAWHHAFVGEILMTFLLVYVVLQTAVDRGSLPNRSQACLAIGLAVFLGNVVLIPVDGCSINPVRSLGSSVAWWLVRGGGGAAFQDLWIFWTAPFVGAALACGLYELNRLAWPQPAGEAEVAKTAAVADAAVATSPKVMATTDAQAMHARKAGPHLGSPEVVHGGPACSIIADRSVAV